LEMRAYRQAQWDAGNQTDFMRASKLPELNPGSDAARKLIAHDHAHARKRNYREFMYTLRDCAPVCLQTIGRISRANHNFCARHRLRRSLLSY
jgi:hypothetical protein